MNTEPMIIVLKTRSTSSHGTRTCANTKHAHTLSPHISNRVPPSSHTQSKMLFAQEKANVAKRLEGSLPFQASKISQLKEEFGEDDDDSSSEWDPDA